jgi:hypothetical protein
MQANLVSHRTLEIMYGLRVDKPWRGRAESLMDQIKYKVFYFDDGSCPLPKVWRVQTRINQL